MPRVDRPCGRLLLALCRLRRLGVGRAGRRRLGAFILLGLLLLAVAFLLFAHFRVPSRSPGACAVTAYDMCDRLRPALIASRRNRSAATIANPVISEFWPRSFPDVPPSPPATRA